jgi:hypothetical protein
MLCAKTPAKKRHMAISAMKATENESVAILGRSTTPARHHHCEDVGPMVATGL